MKNWIRTLVAVLLSISAGPHADSYLLAAEIPTGTFARLPQISKARLSPNGQYFAALSPIDGRASLVIHDFAGGSKGTVIPPSDKMDFEWVRWVSNDRLVFSMSYFRRRDLVSAIETQLFATDRDGTNLQSMVLPATTRQSASRAPIELPSTKFQDSVIDWLPDDPLHILLVVDSDNDGRSEIRRINVNDGSYDELTKGNIGISHWLVDQNSVPRIGYGVRHRTPRFRLQLADGEWISGDFDDWPYGEFLALAFAADPSVVYARGIDETGYRVIRKMNLSTGEILDDVYAPEHIDVDDLLFDPVTGFAAGVRYTEHLPTADYFDETMASLQRSVDGFLPGTSNVIVDMSTDRSRVFVLASSDIDAGTYYLWDRDEKRMDFVVKASPDLPVNAMAPVEPVTYSARDGQRISGYLTVPRGVAREGLPVVVVPHGDLPGRDTREFSYFVQFLASRGYAVFQPNFRGSSGYGQEFLRAGRKQWGGLMQDDVLDGARWLVEQGIGDPQRMCIVGWSYGGYVAALAAIEKPRVFRCAASINGILDLVKYMVQRNRYSGQMSAEYIGLEGASTKSVSPYHQAKRFRIPMLIIQARDDALVDSSQGRRMARRLRQVTKSVEYIEVEHGGHSMNNEGARLIVLNALEAFLALHIGSN